MIGLQLAAALALIALMLGAIRQGLKAARMWRRGEVCEVTLIGGPMDGRKVLATIGCDYYNFKPGSGLWVRHRYEVVPGGWGMYRGMEIREPGSWWQNNN